MDGIEGESKDAKHDKWIDILSVTNVSLRPEQTDSSDGGVSEPVVFRHIVDKATPKLQEACMKGTSIATARIDYCSTDGGAQIVVRSVTFEGVRIIKAEVETEDLADGGYRLVETVYLSVEKMTWTENTVGFGNTSGGKKESGSESSRNDVSEPANPDNGIRITLIAIGAVVFALLTAVIIWFAAKKKKASKE